jgi:hypothetical protein
MSISKLALFIAVILIAAIVSAGFLYLQSEITGLRNAGHPSQPTSPPVATANPEATPSPNYLVSSTEDSTTTTNNGTTLVCTWTEGAEKPNTVIFLDNGSNSVIYINSITITNIGKATAYVSGVRFQTYSSDGKLLQDQTKPIYISINPFLPTPPITLPPGNSTGVGYTQTALEQNPNINEVGSDAFATFVITPVWSNTSSS